MGRSGGAADPWPWRKLRWRARGGSKAARPSRPGTRLLSPSCSRPRHPAPLSSRLPSARTCLRFRINWARLCRNRPGAKNWS